MAEKNAPTRALAAYYRAMTRYHRVTLPLDELPSRTGEATIHERAYVMMGNDVRTLAVYRVKPGGLYRLKHWPKELELRP